MFSKLSEGKILEIEEIVKKWSISRLNADLDEIYKKLATINFKSVVNSFTSRLREIPYKFTQSEEVSGSICFFGGVFMSLVNTGKVETVDELFTFALCYMLVDHFLDDSNNSDSKKDEYMKDIYNLLVYDKINSENKLITSGHKRYKDLIEKIPKSKYYILSLFESEIKGAAISKSNKLPREDYKNIAEEKGGRTSLAISQIIGLSDVPMHYDCGKCIQLVDDLLDIKDDTNLDIYTLARYDLENNNMDHYVYESLKEIDKLDSTYNLFKIILVGGIILGVHDNNNYVSSEINSIFKKYDYFDVDMSKESLTEWFYKKLYEYIESIEMH